MPGGSPSCLVNSKVSIRKQDQVSKYKYAACFSSIVNTFRFGKSGKLGELKGVLEQTTNLSKKTSRTYQLSKRTKR